MRNPLISVIVPIYKVEPYLDRCVQSIVGQSYQNLEIILVDDGSPDSCPDMCDSWEKKDCRVKVIHKKNGGSSSARNAGLDICSGEYVTFVDGDDWIEPEYYRNVIDIMLCQNVQIGCVGRYDVKETTMAKRVGLCPNSQRILNPEQMLKHMLTWRECDFSCWDKMFAASLWKDIRFPQGKTSEDVGVLYRIVGQANGVAMYPRPMYNYLHRKGSITTVNRETKNFHIVEFADDICTYVQHYYPNILKEAKYFKLRCLLYWHRAFYTRPTTFGQEFSFYRASRTWLRDQLLFVLFACEYVGLKEKIWYLLILFKMKGVVRWLARRKIK